MSLDAKIEALTTEIATLAKNYADVKANGDADSGRDAYKADIERLDKELRDAETERDLAKLQAKAATFRPESKAAAILLGAADHSAKATSYGIYSETNFLSALVDRKNGDPDAAMFVKSVLGTSAATGQAIVPNNFVSDLVEQVARGNIYRQLMNVIPVTAGAGIDIPYEITAIQKALLQGAFGSNKDIRDFSFGEATATFYTIAQIADIGNQLLRQSNGAAERVARNRLAASIAKAEADFIINGTGSSQPQGILDALMDYGDVAAFKYALNTESRAAALGNGLSKLEALDRQADGIVMHPTDFWEMTVETLGSSGSGGWAMDPTGGSTTPRVSVWGVPVFRDTNLTVGTALVGLWGACDIYVDGAVTIRVSDEAGTRFDQNITGFRAEEQFAFNAEPWVRTGHFIKVTGL